MVKGSARLGNSVRRWPWGFLGLVVVVGLVENGLGRHEIHYSTEWSAAWKRAGEAARKEAVQADLLCFGDSLVMHGVAPRILEKRLGRSAYNVAVFKGQAPSSYFLLKAALDAGARPSAVLIDGELLTDNPLEMVRLWPELASYEELFDLAWTAHRAEFFGSVALGRLMPSVRMRYEVREFAAARLEGRDYSARLALAPRMRNWTQNLGANIRPRGGRAGGNRGEDAGGVPAVGLGVSSDQRQVREAVFESGEGSQDPGVLAAAADSAGGAGEAGSGGVVGQV